MKSNRPAMQKAYPPSWFDGRMGSLKAMWKGLNPPQVSAQLVLELQRYRSKEPDARPACPVL